MRCMCDNRHNLFNNLYSKRTTSQLARTSWDDPMAPGFDNTPTITGGRTMGYSGGTYITTAMPFDG